MSSVLLRLRLEGLEVVSDLSVLTLNWQVRKFLLQLDKQSSSTSTTTSSSSSSSTTQPSTSTNTSYLMCIPGTLPEVCDHLWSVQELFLKQILPPVNQTSATGMSPDTLESTTTLLTLSMRELLDPSQDAQISKNGFYENAVCLDDNSGLVVHLQMQLLPSMSGVGNAMLTSEGLLNLPMLHRNGERVRPPPAVFLLKLRIVNTPENVRQLLLPSVRAATTPSPGAAGGAGDQLQQDNTTNLQTEDQLLALRVRGIVQNARQAIFTLVLVASWEEALESLKEVEEQCVVLVNRNFVEEGRLPPVREEEEEESICENAGGDSGSAGRVKRTGEGYFVSPDDVSPSVASQRQFEIGSRTCSYPIDVRPLIKHVEDAMQIDDGVSDLLDKTMQIPITLTVPALALPANTPGGSSVDDDNSNVLTFEANLEKRSFPSSSSTSSRGNNGNRLPFEQRMSVERPLGPIAQEINDYNSTEGSTSGPMIPGTTPAVEMMEEVSPRWSPKMSRQQHSVSFQEPSNSGANSQYHSAKDNSTDENETYNNALYNSSSGTDSAGDSARVANSFQANNNNVGGGATSSTSALNRNNPSRSHKIPTPMGLDNDPNDDSSASEQQKYNPNFGRASWTDPDQKHVPSFLPNASSPGSVISQTSSALGPNAGIDMNNGGKAVNFVDQVFQTWEKRPRQWRLSIELRALKLTHFQAKVFVKYFYPFVQQVKPFRTNPPTICRKNSVTYLPHGFAAYHFTDTSVAKLKEQLLNPLHKTLRCEVWQRDTHTSDQQLGQCTMDVEQILNLPEVTKQATETFNQNGQNVMPKVRTLDQTLPIVSSMDGSTQGTLRVVVFLEDLGEVVSGTSNGEFFDAMETPTDMEMADFSASSGVANGKSSTAEQSAKLRSLPQYSAAYELELWKRAEEAQFKVKLQEDERINRLRLQQEFEDKEQRRSIEFNNKKNEILQLEQTLKKKLQMLQARENEVELKDVEAGRRAEEASRMKAILETETEAKVRLLKQEMSDELLLERDKTRRIEQKCHSLDQECKQWQERYTQIEAEFVQFRKQQFADDYSNPIEQVRADLKIKQYECKELQKLVEQLRASRDHFKQSVTKLCSQVTSLEEEKRELEREVLQKGTELRATLGQTSLNGNANRLLSQNASAMGGTIGGNNSTIRINNPSGVQHMFDAGNSTATGAQMNLNFSNAAAQQQSMNLDENIGNALRKIQDELKSLHDNYSSEEAPKMQPPIPVELIQQEPSMIMYNNSTLQVPQTSSSAATSQTSNTRMISFPPGLSPHVAPGGAGAGGGLGPSNFTNNSTQQQQQQGSISAGAPLFQPQQDQQQPSTGPLGCISGIAQAMKVQLAPAAPVQPSRAPAAGASSQPAQLASQPQTDQQPPEVLSQERKRLETLRDELLESGLYAPDDAIFQHMGL
ncbi:unnamed protein product [Amoebophrya sp. A120]|nr:unnamed protein product [Amoebophrya sp. A120]|eukprot:GSA120T00016219001.1